MPFAPLDDSYSPPSEELRHFTNRVRELEAFGRALAIPAGQDLPAIMFYGVGGTGKTWVLKRLWQSLDGRLPCAYLDLDPNNPGDAACHTDWSRAAQKFRDLGDRENYQAMMDMLARVNEEMPPEGTPGRRFTA